VTGIIPVMDVASLGVGTPETSAPSTSLIRWVLPAGIVALAIALIGGYAFRWSWTGITPRDQMWDLLHVIVLPVVLATLPIWYRTRNRWKMEWHAVFGVLGAVFAVLVFGGYALNWRWTGFQGNTLWDWITLILLPVALVTVRVWPTSGRHVTHTHTLAFSLLGAAWLITLIGGYGADWVWTGYQGNSLWDWLQLLLAPVAVSTVVIPFAVRWVSGDVARIAQERERERAAQANR
jgi:hypothetical protein